MSQHGISFPQLTDLQLNIGLCLTSLIGFQKYYKTNFKKKTIIKVSINSIHISLLKEIASRQLYECIFTVFLTTEITTVVTKKTNVTFHKINNDAIQARNILTDN